MIHCCHWFICGLLFTFGWLVEVRHREKTMSRGRKSRTWRENHFSWIDVCARTAATQSHSRGWSGTHQGRLTSFPLIPPTPAPPCSYPFPIGIHAVCSSIHRNLRRTWVRRHVTAARSIFCRRSPPGKSVRYHRSVWIFLVSSTKSRRKENTINPLFWRTQLPFLYAITEFSIFKRSALPLTFLSPKRHQTVGLTEQELCICIR